MGAVLNMDNSLISNKLTLTFVIKYLFNKMRFIFSKIFSVLFSKKEVSLGSDNAGKTILLYQMQAMSKAKFVFIKNVIILKQFVIDSSDKERIDIAKQELFLTDEIKNYIFFYLLLYLFHLIQLKQLKQYQYLYDIYFHNLFQ